MPIAEAIAADVPVIASDIPSHRAIAGDAADLVDPLDGAGWMTRIEAAAEAGFAAERAERRRACAAELPTWDGHFRRLSEAIAEI